VWLILLALGGCAVAAYLAWYQTGVVAHVWEPFFGDGSRAILHSSVSRLLPIPDAALGAFGYLMEAVCGAIGGRNRWSVTPWIVLLYGGIVGLFALASIALIVLQFGYFHAWCTLCLTSAVISFVIAILAFDEPRASWQFLKHEAAQGRSVWRALWGRTKERAQVQPAANR
jgi:hypothetical protein